MKKITLLFMLMVCSYSALAQFSYPPIPGPVNVSSAAFVIYDLNTLATIPPGLYRSVTVTADWEAGAGGPWSSEAVIQLESDAGFGPIAESPQAADNGNSVTLTFEAFFAANLDPSTNVLAELTLAQTFSPSDANWSNIVITLNEALPPPPNDECATATPYTSSFTMFTEGNCMTNNVLDLTGATNDADSDTPSCDAAGNFGVWYTWTATSAGLSFTSGLNAPGIAVYDAGTCGSLTQVGCLNNISGTITDLVLGNNYLIHIWDDTIGNSVEFCLEEFTPPPPPANDECAAMGAELLVASTDDTCTTTSGTTESSTQTLAGCLGTANDDVWYRFVAVSENQNILVANTGGTADIVTEVFDACGGTSILCQDTPNSPIELTGLTVGTEYFFRIYSWSATATVFSAFNVCVITPPPPPPAPDNDLCDGAVAISCGDTLSSTTLGATGAGGNTSCSGSIGNDVWFQFTGDGSSVEVTVVAANEGSQIGVYESTDGTCLGFIDGTCFAEEDGFGALATSVTFASTAGTVYYFNVGAWISSGDDFDFDISVACLPPNDECATAEVIAIDQEVSGNNTGATDSNVGDACVTGNVRDLWYEFVGPASLEAHINIDAGFQYAVYSDCSGTLVGSCNTSPVDVVEGTTYYLRVSDDGTGTTRASGAFNLVVSSAILSNNEFDSEAMFTYYPNPVKNTLTLNGQQNITNVTMYNMLGQEVLRLSPNTVNTEVDMSSLVSGAYFVNVSVADTTQTIRIIKQ